MVTAVARIGARAELAGAAGSAFSGSVAKPYSAAEGLTAGRATRRRFRAPGGRYVMLGAAQRLGEALPGRDTDTLAVPMV